MSDVEAGHRVKKTSSNDLAQEDDADQKMLKKSSGTGMWGSLSERNQKVVFCFIGLQVSYLLWGLTQENLMTQKYKMGYFRSSAFCVFGNRFCALFLSLAIVLYNNATTKKPQKSAPFYYYAPSSLSNSLSSWAQYEALKYVSFPIQVLSKSCKVIPVMMVRASSVPTYLPRCVAMCCLASYFIVLHRLAKASRSVTLCIALHRFASPCIALHRAASRCIALHRLTSPCIALRRAA
jgi:hypothetical protein